METNRLNFYLKSEKFHRIGGKVKNLISIRIALHHFGVCFFLSLYKSICFFQQMLLLSLMLVL